MLVYTCLICLFKENNNFNIIKNIKFTYLFKKKNIFFLNIYDNYKKIKKYCINKNIKFKFFIKDINKFSYKSYFFFKNCQHHYGIFDKNNIFNYSFKFIIKNINIIKKFIYYLNK
ncbi:hypothetical protein ACT2CR_00285 [Candidatus Vidania fulgoroideorum]